MFNQKLKFIFLGILLVTLSGCLSFGSLNHKQVKMLKQQGFVLTDEGWSLGLSERLLFDFNATEISTQKQTEITRLATQLHKFKLNKVKVVGHSDNVGNPEYNLKLSEKRAESVAQIFLANQFQAQNIQTIGKGSTQPIDQANTEEARAANRRVAIIIIP